MPVAPLVDRQLGVTEILQNAAVATGNGAVCDMTGCNAVTFNVSIGTTATVSFEVSYDGGATWTALTLTNVATGAGAASATASGNFGLPSYAAPIPAIRARISAWTSGAVTVQSRKAYR